MKLYTYFRSSAAFRVRIALNIKSLAHELVGIDLRAAENQHTKPAYLALNPQGLVPALEDQGTTLCQSLAVLEYLEEAYPDPPLLPRAPLERAQVRSMALAVACDIHPLNNLRVLNYLRSPLGANDLEVNTWYRHWIATGLVGLEEQARRLSGDRRHMFGSSVTLADICLVPQMYNAVRFKCDLEPYPTLRSINTFLSAEPAFAKAMPEVQPDAQRSR
jgi:maleylacetoacetate isomerase